MIRKCFLVLVAICILQHSFAQDKQLQRPKLVVGVVVDQMRWDYLYRYYERYAKNGGFKRLISQGFSCDNTFIPYAPTVTACGHTCIYTGSVPAVHGITGNAWYDQVKKRTVYCTEDDSVNGVGTTDSETGQQSPRNMLATTIGDELRLATNFQSKVIGIAMKDRGGILPAGHAANAAYWYNSMDGNFITSTYYMQQLPAWVQKFNDRKLVDQFYNEDWKLLYPANTYTQSTADEKAYEAKALGTDQKGFPYTLKKFIKKNYGPVLSTPYGNTLTLEMAKAAIEGEQLGTHSATDMLCISFSSTDYVGHSFGPNSVEAEDTYLRLDKDLGDLLAYLDEKVGKNDYLLFLSADHGVSHVPEFSAENKLPGGRYSSSKMANDLNRMLKVKYGQDTLVVSMYNYQVHLNHDKITNNKLDEAAIKQDIINMMLPNEAISQAFDIHHAGNVPLPGKIKEMLANGYYPTRSGDIQIVLKPGWIESYGSAGTTHGLWNPYDSHIPLLWYGWNIKQGKSNREVYMTDIAPTLAAMLHIEMPNGSLGKVIEEVVK